MSVIVSASIADHENLVFTYPAPYFENRTYFPPSIHSPLQLSLGGLQPPALTWAASQDDCFGGGHGLQVKPRRLLCGIFAGTAGKETCKDGLGCKAGVAWGPFLPPLGCGVLANEDQEKTTTVEPGRDDLGCWSLWIQLCLKRDVFFFLSNQYELDFVAYK